MQSDPKSACLKRLHRTEAQVCGVARMVEQDRYCIDVVTPVSAIRATLARVEDEIIPDHVGHCVEHAIMSGNRAEQRQKVFELVDALGGWVVEIVKLWV
jgi:CsoR family transcriptional regulator, copper-sensing transcriptional repressor